MKIKLLVVSVFLNTMIFAQVKQTSNNLFQAKEWSKQISLTKAKSFFYRDVIGVSEDVQKFSIIPLAAASSGELTTLLYRSSEKEMEGMILSFYGNYWNDQGVEYQGYGFYHMNKTKVIQLIDKMDKAIEENKRFLSSDGNNNNIFFAFEDMEVLIYIDGGIKSRIFWKTFDATWDQTAYRRTKKRFERWTD